VGCDGFNWRMETPCQLECGAKHDKCYDENHCTSGSWPGQSAKCGCDQTSACAKCNSDVSGCIKRCGRNESDNRAEPNYYCAAQHRFVRIPGDFPNREAAEKACERDAGKDCKIPVTPYPKPKKPWYRRFPWT
jgi:hypothetical protein